MRATVYAMVLLLLTACGGEQGRQMNTTIQRGPMPEGGSFAGIWFSTWGEMAITAQGSSIVGEFCQEDRNRYGRLEGTAQGNVMTFHWLTHDVSMSGASRETEGSAIVQFSYQEPAEQIGATFEGTWGYGNNNDGGGVLRGEFSPRRSDRFLRGQLQVECPLREAAEGGAPLSDDDVGDNPSDEEEEGSSDDSSDEDNGTSVLDEI